MEPMGEQQTEGRAESKSAFCAIRQKLFEAFWEATEQVTMLQDQQVAAVIRGGDFTHFNDLICRARERKNQAKYAFLIHAEVHQC
jgi:hypothetical protein